MSLLQRLRDALAGPARVSGGGDSEADADLHDEYGTPDTAESDLERMAETGSPGPLARPGYAAAEAAEAGEAEIESEEAPPDPAP